MSGVIISPFELILSKFNKKHKAGDGFNVPCPTHHDEKASLHVSEAPSKAALLYCHAGCRTEDIVAALGLEMKDLFPSKQDKPQSSKGKIVATYDYLNKNGNLIYQAVRLKPKKFFQRRPDPNKPGDWINNTQGINPIPYRLPELLAAIEQGEVIYITEGEKDVLNLVGLGLAATCNHGGAGKWKASHSKWFAAGARVVILPDNDDAGRDHALKIAQQLHEQGCKVKVVELPGLAPKGDVSDWLQSGGTKDELKRLVIDVPLWEPKTPNGLAFSLTDLGNAQRLVARHGKDIRHNHTWGKWLVWGGPRWQIDNTAVIERLAKDTVKQIYREAADAEDKDTRQAIAEHAKKSESKRALKDMIELAKSEPGIPILSEQLDANPWLLNCLNGTVDLRTGKLHEHNRDHLITKLAPVNYNPTARSTLFDAFLKRVIPDPDLRLFIQRAAGYSITGDTGEEKLFFTYGPPATGKSTLLNAIAETLGDYAITADFSTFLAKDRVQRGPSSDVADLFGRRFVQSLEVDDGSRMAEGLIKMITGGDRVRARHLYKDSFEFIPTCKLWLSANVRPRVREDDAAMWRRILQVPFDQQIPKDERDPNVKKQLRDTKNTGPAIMAWLVTGCLLWQREGLRVPDIVEQTTQEYRAEMDPLKDFIDDCCIVADYAQVDNAALWTSYSSWCQENGEKYPLGRKRFTQSMENRGYTRARSDRGRFWRGIGLLHKSTDNLINHDTSSKNDTSRANLRNFSLIGSREGELRKQVSEVSEVSEADDATAKPECIEAGKCLNPLECSFWAIRDSNLKFTGKCRLRASANAR